MHIGPRGLYDEQRPGKRPGDGGGLHGPYPLLQQKDRKQDGEKGRELVEHIGVREVEPVDGVEIQHQPRRAENAPQQHVQPRPLLDAHGDMLPEDYYVNYDRRHEIAEEGLLHGGQVPREADEGGHAGKAQGRADDAQGPLGPVRQAAHVRRCSTRRR